MFHVKHHSLTSEPHWRWFGVIGERAFFGDGGTVIGPLLAGKEAQEDWHIQYCRDGILGITTAFAFAAVFADSSIEGSVGRLKRGLYP